MNKEEALRVLDNAIETIKRARSVYAEHGFEFPEPGKGLTRAQWLAKETPEGEESFAEFEARMKEKIAQARTNIEHSFSDKPKKPKPKERFSI